MRIARSEAERLGMEFKEFVELLKEIRNLLELQSKYLELRDKKKLLEREIDFLNSELEELREERLKLRSELDKIRYLIAVETGHLEKIMKDIDALRSVKRSILTDIELAEKGERENNR